MTAALRHRVLDQILEVRAPTADLLAQARLAYASFPAADTDAPPTVVVTTDGRRVTWQTAGEARASDLLPPPWSTWHLRTVAHQAVLAALARDHFLPHGAAVRAGGKAVLLVGGSGTGKTSLALALHERGLPLLCEGQAPIHRETGLVQPFPRGLEVVTAATAGRSCRKETRAAPAAAAAAPPGWVVFLGELFPGAQALHLEVGCVPGAAPAVARLLGELGVAGVAVTDEGGLGVVTGELPADPTARGAPGLEAIHERLRTLSPPICYASARMARAADFAQPLRLAPVSPARTLLGLSANSLGATRAAESWPRLRRHLEGVPAVLLTGGTLAERAGAVLELVGEAG